MKILKRNNNNKFPKVIECINCGSQLEFDQNDIEDGYSGQATVTCPVCHSQNYLNDFGIDEFDHDVNQDTVIFPNHFYHFKSNGSTCEEVREVIKHLIQKMRRTGEPIYYQCDYHKFIFIQSYPGDETYYVAVADGYYDLNIPFEADDYNVDWKIEDEEEVG